MDLQSIYNIIIAAVPSVAAIVTIIATVAKAIKAFRKTDGVYEKRYNYMEDYVRKLEKQNESLMEAVRLNQEQVKQLNKDVYKVINHVNINESK